MAKKTVYASEQAIPARMKVKDNIVLTLFATRMRLTRYRQKQNPRDIADFKNGVVTLFDLVKQDYNRDPKLKAKYKNLPFLTKYLGGGDWHKHGIEWWINRYIDVDGLIFDLGITKITQYSDEDDDFAGVDDI